MSETVNNNVDNNQNAQIEVSAPLDMSSSSVAPVANQVPVQQPLPNNNDVQIEIDPEMTFNLGPIVNEISQANNVQPAPITNPTPVQTEVPAPVVDVPVVMPQPVVVEQPAVPEIPVVEPVNQVQSVTPEQPVIEMPTPVVEPVVQPVAPTPDVVAPVEEIIPPIEPTMNEVNQVIDLQPVTVPEVPEPVAPPNVEGINQITNSTVQHDPEEELEDLSQPNVADVKEQPVSQEMDEDEKLLKAYVGDKYDDFKKKKFNLGFCLFGSAYFSYRKMNSYSILSFFLELILIVALPILRVGYAFLVNGAYLKYAKKKVEQIKNANVGKSFEELMNIVAEAGKPNMMNLIVTTSIYIFIVIIAVAILCATVLAPTLAKFNIILYNK